MTHGEFRQSTLHGFQTGEYKYWLERTSVIQTYDQNQNYNVEVKSTLRRSCFDVMSE